MGIERLKYLTLAMAIVMTANCSAAPEENTLQARQMLKDYGLVNCLKRIDPTVSLLSKDLGLSSRSLHFMGRGMHQIVQDEETFETIHDPYKATLSYMSSKAPELYGVMKNGKISKSYGCIQVYHSEPFDTFIKSQDQYVYR